MIDTIQIIDFQDLNIQLNNCGKINYLVGKNGCGKTRILTAISNKLGGSINNVPNGIHYIILSPEKKGIAINPMPGSGGGQSNLSDEMNETLNTLQQPIVVREKIKSKTEINHLTGEQNEIFTDQLKYKEKLISNISFSQGTNYFHNLFQKIISEITKRETQLTDVRGKYVAIIVEDIEKLLHPTAQKLLPKILEEKITELNVGVEFQFFISTHSPFIIRGALNSPTNKIFHIKENSQIEPINSYSLKVNNGREFDDILNDLGFEMKDLFYSNKLIYVEGPVDVLYINYWLQKYIQEENIESIFKGLDFDFVEYGGSLAAHLTMEFNQGGNSSEILETTELVNIFSLNRQILFITDNDTNGDAFEKSKNRIKEIIEKNNNGSVFYRETSIVTIEEFLTEESSKSKNKNSKVEAAVTNLKYWKENNFGLNKFKPEVKTLVELMYNFIKNKNGS